MYVTIIFILMLNTLVFINIKGTICGVYLFRYHNLPENLYMHNEKLLKLYYIKENCKRKNKNENCKKSKITIGGYYLYLIALILFPFCVVINIMALLNLLNLSDRAAIILCSSYGVIMFVLTFVVASVYVIIDEIYRVREKRETKQK